MENNQIEFSLDLEIIKDIPFDKYAKDFTFIVDGKKYSTPRIVADILSPLIRNLHFQDSTIQEYYINSEIKENFEIGDDKIDYFSNFLNLIKFEKKLLNSKEQNIYSAYFNKIGNIDACLELHPEIISGLKIENAIENLNQIEKITSNFSVGNSKFKGMINKVYSFISNNFECIDKEKMSQLSINHLDEIIGNDSLKISDEDSLFDFVMNLYEKDHKYSVLFEYILFSNLSENKLKKFVEVFNIEYININIWKSFCQRIFKNEEKTNKNIKRYCNNNQFILFKNEKGKEFDGIMNYLNKKAGGNSHDKGEVEITSNSIYKNYHPKNLINYYDNDLFYYPDGNNKGVFVCFDFKDKSIKLESYSLKSCNYDANQKNLKNWAIQVSNDGENWEEIDRRENESCLNGRKFTSSFSISNGKDEFYRYVRLLETGTCWNKENPRYDGIFSMIEFFGQLKQPK